MRALYFLIETRRLFDSETKKVSRGGSAEERIRTLRIDERSRILSANVKSIIIECPGTHYSPLKRISLIRNIVVAKRLTPCTNVTAISQ